MSKTRDRKRKLNKDEKAALRRLEQTRIRFAKTENRVTLLRQRLTQAEEKLARRAARLADAEEALKSVTAPERATEDAHKGAAKDGAEPPQESVAPATTPLEAAEELSALSASASPAPQDGAAPPASASQDGVAEPDTAPSKPAATTRKQPGSAKPSPSARSRARRKATSGES